MYVHRYTPCPTPGNGHLLIYYADTARIRRYFQTKSSLLAFTDLCFMRYTIDNRIRINEIL